MEISKTIATTETQIIRLTEYDIINLLIEHGIILSDSPPQRNKDLKVHVEIPGGGDWSNTDLDISKDHPIIVTVVYYSD